MTNKFKIGDVVVCNELCSDTNTYSWFHRNSMKIIAIDRLYYYVDYWHEGKDFSDVHQGIYGLGGGITEECLEYSIKQIRKDKIKKLQLN